MNLAADWDDRNFLIEHLGAELYRGRLAIFLGAGLSKGFGLPNWFDLVCRMCRSVGEPEPNSSDNLTTFVAGLKIRRFSNDEPEFLKLVQESLYSGVDTSFSALRRNQLVAAIGALVMASQRGAASAVITLNFDDLLERYLEFHGFVVKAVWEERHWASSDDVRVYHPHGLLPADATRKASSRIVFDVSEFHTIISGGSQWRPLLETVLRTHTTIYIGLSGDDMHLQSLLNELTNKHAIAVDRFAYHGVLFGKGAKADINLIFERMGVFSHLYNDHNDLPNFLFEVCQSARKRRIARAS